MRVLVACEESQAVCKEFRKLGHEAFSCDTLHCSGGHPEWHIQHDVLEILDGGSFLTQSGNIEFIESWDLMIAHPPCTYLSHAGARWLYPKGQMNVERFNKGMEAKEFFMKLLNASIPKIIVENPLPSKVYGLPKHTQIIQPYEYGHEAQKKTLLWIKGLPELKPTLIVGKGEMVTYKSGKKKAKWFMDAAHAKTPEERAKLRSKTFIGIAKAMAEQWGTTLNLNSTNEVQDVQ